MMWFPCLLLGLCFFFSHSVFSARGQDCPTDFYETAPPNQTCAVVNWTTPAWADDYTNHTQYRNGDCWPKGLWTQIGLINRTTGDLVCNFSVTVEVIRCNLTQFSDGTRTCSGQEEDVYGSVCNHTCDTGYTLTGTAVTECTDTWQWATPLPYCQTKQCSPAPTVQHSDPPVCTDGSRYMSECSYACDMGYQLVGNDSITCREDTTWSDVPTCDAINCSTAPTVQQSGPAVCTNGTQYMSVCSYTCETGYQHSGNDNITCRWDRTWSDVPTCDAIQCSPAPVVQHGNLEFCTNGSQYMSKCSYTCEAGYQLVGSANITCKADTNWTSVPTCDESCSWVRHHCWPGDCAGDYASNCACRAGFTRRNSSDALCDPNLAPDLHTCHFSVTDANGNVSEATYPDSLNPLCGTQTETWIQADPQTIHFKIHVDLSLTLGPLADYVSESEVGITGVHLTMTRVNVSGDETAIQNETLQDLRYCQQSVSSRNPLGNNTSFICNGTLNVPALDLQGGESLCVDVVAYSGGYYRVQDDQSNTTREEFFQPKATSTKRVCFVRDCADGWYTSTCDKECLNCDVTGSCARDTGVCDYGCSPGWLVNGTIFCDTECPAQSFGKDCQSECGHCWDSQPCRHDNGTCELGCAEGYGGELCRQRLDSGLLLPIILAVLCGVVVGIILLISVAIFRRKREKKTDKRSISPSDSEKAESGSVSPLPSLPRSCSKGTESMAVSSSLPSSRQTDCEKVSAFPTAFKRQTTSEFDDQSSTLPVPSTPITQSDIAISATSSPAFDFPEHPLFIFLPRQNPAASPIQTFIKADMTPKEPAPAKLHKSAPDIKPSKRKTRPATDSELPIKESNPNDDDDDEPVPVCEFRFLHSYCHRPCCATKTCTTPNCPIHSNHPVYSMWGEKEEEDVTVSPWDIKGFPPE